MANKQQQPLSRLGCAKAIFFGMAVVIFMVAFIDSCEIQKSKKILIRQCWSGFSSLLFFMDCRMQSSKRAFSIKKHGWMDSFYNERRSKNTDSMGSKGQLIS
jgi:hypothetical protein